MVLPGASSQKQHSNQSGFFPIHYSSRKVPIPDGHVFSNDSILQTGSSTQPQVMQATTSSAEPLPNNHTAQSVIAGQLDSIKRQFRFDADRPDPEQLRLQIEEIKAGIGQYSLKDCQQWLDWLAVLALQQSLDIELYSSCSAEVEKCFSSHLSWLYKDCRALDKKKLQTGEKELKSAKSTLELEKANLERGISRLRAEMQELRQFKTKYEKKLVEAAELESARSALQKRVDNFLAEEAKWAQMDDLAGRLKETERDRDSLRHKYNEAKRGDAESKKRIEELEAALAVERAKKKGGIDEEKAQLKRELKKKAAELDSAKAELKRVEKNLAERDGDNSELDKARHSAMKLREKLTRMREKVEKTSELSGELEKEQKLRETAEQNLAALKKEMRKMAKQQSENPASSTSCTRENTPQQILSAPFDALTRVNEILAKKNALDKAIDTLKSKKSCEECRTARDELGRVQRERDALSEELVKRGVEIAQLRQSQERFGVEMIDLDARRLADARKRAAEDAQLSNDMKRPRRDEVSSVSSDSTPSQPNKDGPDPSREGIQQSKLPETSRQSACPILKSMLSGNANADDPVSSQSDLLQRRRTGSIKSDGGPSESLVATSCVPTRPSSNPTDSSHAQDPSTVSMPASTQIPSPRSLRNLANEVVTSFMKYASKHADREVNSLIPEFFEQTPLPSNTVPLIAEQLMNIALVAESTRQENTGSRE